MTSTQAAYQIKLGLNKLDSKDYQNLTPESQQEAVNTAVQRFIRRRLPRKESNNLVAEDIQILLKTFRLSGSQRDVYFLSHKLPTDYFGLSRLNAICTKGSCNRNISSTWIEDGNVDKYLSDWAMQPSWDFEQTFHTISGQKIKSYHNKNFDIKELELNYYRQPQYIQFPNVEGWTGQDGKDMTWEWKDDIADQIIAEAIRILAENIGDYNTSQIQQQVLTQ